MKPQRPDYHDCDWDCREPDMCEIPMDWGRDEALQMQAQEWADICRERSDS